MAEYENDYSFKTKEIDKEIIISDTLKNLQLRVYPTKNNLELILRYKSKIKRNFGFKFVEEEKEDELVWIIMCFLLFLTIVIFLYFIKFFNPNIMETILVKIENFLLKSTEIKF